MIKQFEKMPIIWRLCIGYTLIMGILFTLLGCGIYRLVQTNLMNSVDAALLASAQAIQNSRHTRQNLTAPALENFLTQFLGEKSIRLYATLIDVSNKSTRLQTRNIRVRLEATPYSIRRARLGLSTYETFSFKNFTAVRQITLPASKKGGFTGEIIQVGAPLASTFATLRDLKIILILVFPIALLLSILCGYWVTRRSIRPVKKITQAAAKLHIDDLSNRLPLPFANDELRELTETFNSMLDRLEDSFKRHKRFTGDVSHELRTSLAVLRGEAQLALRRERDMNYYRDSMATILEESTHMSKIVEDLLLLSRAQSKSVVMQWDPIDMAQFIKDLKNSLKPIFQEKNIRLNIYEDKSIRDFLGSSNYLHIALKNILQNAAKHSQPDSQVDMTIFRDMENKLVFRISDKGEGIPDEALPYIFDSFFRADTARNRKLGGAGVGLSLALALVKLHNGTIQVESKNGNGATFIVTINQPEFSEESQIPEAFITDLPITQPQLTT